jgi:hypothetical protein
MIDLLMIALLVAAFAGAGVYVRICDHIAGPPW